MESRNDETNFRSLPPLVEGKVHGYLKLVIDEIVWSRRSPGDVTVLASWWGELDSAQFRPADIKQGNNRAERDISETYTIRTNVDLFEEYLKNCENVELVVISEKNHQVVGTARVSELSNLLSGKCYFQYVPILNDNGSRTGDIRVTMKLSDIQRNAKSPTKKLESKISTRGSIEIQSPPYPDPDTKKNSFLYENDVPVAVKNAKQNENVYRSILKERRLYLTDAGTKSLNEVNDKLVAQVVARAQRLRGAIVKESRDENPLALSESSNDSFSSDSSANNEANLYEYFLGKKMSRLEEKKALNVLRTTSPTPSLIDLAAETIRTCRDEKNARICMENKMQSVQDNRAVNSISIPEVPGPCPREISPIDYVDSLRIAVESLTLSPAGYRRVRSSCLSRGDGIPLSVTYFVQYDSTFGKTKKFNRKIINQSKPVKLCSRKQVGQIIYFNHEAVYDLPKTYLHMDAPLKFRIFHRHLNQRTPTELGIGSIYVADAARARSLSSTQRLIIVNKGIKIGELKVSVELGCDKIHFGKQFVEAVTSAKENIPVLEVSSVSSLETPRYMTATGGDSRERTKPPSSSGNKAENSWNAISTDRIENQESGQRKDPRQQERIIEQENPRRERDDKVLLHGLIYIAQGKDLSSCHTYLISRGFWRDDRAASRVCTQTNDPFYNFHQLVPLVHGQDLLERTRDNYIVVEVYSRQQIGSHELLGISKLSVHRLYVAYRDPQVLPQLLSSKYPVISVDEWVPIINPVTGRACGQIQALVALGTPEQIVLLEMTRGLRDFSVTSEPRRMLDGLSSGTNNPGDTRFSHTEENSSSQQRLNRDNENYLSNRENVEDRSLKNISCQTEITTVNCYKRGNPGEEGTGENPQNNVLNVIVDRLAQALNAPKSSNDQAAQTEIDFRAINSRESSAKLHQIEALNLNPPSNNSFSGDSASEADSQRANFLPSREIYRSVGVGAEVDDPVDPVPSTSYANTNVVTIANRFDSGYLATDLPERKNDHSNSGFNSEIISAPARSHNPAINESSNSERSDPENSSFRAVIEIECALHLPKVEKIDETVEPCTYVTFQRARNHHDTQYGCYVVTNLFPFSCSPKWDWRCDTRLSNDLLENEDKRLILKVWRLVEPETSMEINLERDIVIGFSAIDVSVLTVGFPVVSGWFHVMDFTGKCNGQIKVSVTPLDNIAAFGKNAGQSNTGRPTLPDLDYSNFSSPYPADLRDNGQAPNSERSKIVTNRSQVEDEPVLDMGLNLGDASMSFLSLSLKQKLTELDEIKKRLQTRLHDVTNTAFDDDFDNDYDSPTAEDEDANNGNTEDSRNVLRDLENWEQPREQSFIEQRGPMTNGNRAHEPERFERLHVTTTTTSNNSNSASIDANFTDTGYSTSSNVPSCRNVPNGNRRFHNDHNRSVNGFDRATTYDGGLDNLSNGHCHINRAPNAPNRTDVVNVRNNQGVDHPEAMDFRGSSEMPRNVGSNDGSEEHPTRGARMHISYLLDQLKTQLTAVPPASPPPTSNQPMKRNIMDLITSLRRDNNNFSSDTKCNREVNVRTVPTQTETNYPRETRLTQIIDNSSEARENFIANERKDSSDDRETSSADARTTKRKVSTAIREELVADEADEANETLQCDELSTHLMTTNVRHMDLQSILNPLLYQHVIPDIRSDSNDESGVNSQNSFNNPRTPEMEDIEHLDTRYTANFNTAINNNGLGRLRNLVERENTSGFSGSVGVSSENDEVLRMTPSGLSENIDGNIDVTVIHKPCNDDLMASNSLDSTTTISLENDFQNATENDDNSSLNSTETSVSGVSRQAPDGGNPVEESGPSLITKVHVDSQDSSSTS